MNSHQRRVFMRTHPKPESVVEFWGPRGELEMGIICRKRTLRECRIVGAFGTYNFVPYKLIVRVFP